MRFALFEASPLFAKSDRIEKRIKRTERIGTDLDSPSARPYPPKAEKSVLIRSVRLIRFSILSLLVEGAETRSVCLAY